MELWTKPVKPDRHQNTPSGGRPRVAVSEETIAVLVAERARFHRFVASWIGDDRMADDFLQESLRRALRQGDSLLRGESAVAWIVRILRHAISDHWKTALRSRRVEELFADLPARGENATAAAPDWEVAVRACLRGLLPSLKPRYATVIRRVDFCGESKLEVARELKLGPATMDVLLHRARHALRQRLEILCGACSRERCEQCFGEQRAEKV